MTPPVSAYGAHPVPSTHGPDPVSIDRLPELPGPAGGPGGRPLPRGERAGSEQVRLSLPEVWCGQVGSGDNLQQELANGMHKYHAVYAVPSDGLDRFALVATGLHVDLLQASALIERVYGRALRLDMGTSCGPQFVDISAVRLRSSTSALAALAGSPDALFNQVAADLRAAGFGLITAGDTYAAAAARTKNLIVWLDGPSPSGVCGQGMEYDDPSRTLENWNNLAGKLALVFRSSGGFCNSNTVRHEIGHNLGALQPGAPSAFDGAHCNDAYEDTMCYSQAPRRATGEYHALYFDYGNDDYWDPAGGALPHWTVNLSRFVCPSVDCNLPGGSSGGGLLDSDTDGIPDALDPCPTTPGTACPAGADATANRAGSARARVSRRRMRGGRWRLRIRVTGRGRARVVVKCRRRTVYRRAVSIPRTVSRRVRCRPRPRVTVTALRPDQRR
ncbi:MAG: hypothetical protein WD844_17625 [Thermoleophilaceae bacterium]